MNLLGSPGADMICWACEHRDSSEVSSFHELRKKTKNFLLNTVDFSLVYLAQEAGDLSECRKLNLIYQFLYKKCIWT